MVKKNKSELRDEIESLKFEISAERHYQGAALTVLITFFSATLVLLVMEFSKETSNPFNLIVLGFLVIIGVVGIVIGKSQLNKDKENEVRTLYSELLKKIKCY